MTGSAPFALRASQGAQGANASATHGACFQREAEGYGGIHLELVIMGISWGYHGDIMGISWRYHGDIMGNNGTCWNFFFKCFFYFYWWGTWTGHVWGWSLDRWRRISAGILELSRIWRLLSFLNLPPHLRLGIGVSLNMSRKWIWQPATLCTAKYRWNWRDPNTTIALNFYKDAEIWWNLELKTHSNGQRSGISSMDLRRSCGYPSLRSRSSLSWSTASPYSQNHQWLEVKCRFFS